MKKIFLFSMLSFFTLAFSQENSSEKIDISEIDEETHEVPFAVIDQVPVFKGCSESLENESQRRCMSEGISNHVIRNFNVKIAKDLGLPDGIVRISVIFKINKEGKVVDIRTRAPHPKLEEEAIRVIKLIPQMEKAGYMRGKPVTVPYSLPIVFKIDNTIYLSKKELRKLKKQKKKANQ